MNKTDAIPVINNLQLIFSYYGLPAEIVSDNGPPLRSKLFKRFCQLHGIKLTEPAALHPQSNGAAERAVRTAKSAFDKMLLESKTQQLPMESLVSKFLFDYRNTPSTATGSSPNDMIFAFKPKTVLEMIKPDRDKLKESTIGRIGDKFEVGQKVWFRVYNSQPRKWTTAIIKERISAVIYLVSVNHQIKRAHRDQLKERVDRLPLIYCRNNEEEDIRESAEREVVVDANPSIRQVHKRKLTPDKPSSRVLRPRHLLKAPL